MAISDTRAIMSGLGAFLILHIGYLCLEASTANAFLPMAWLFFATPVLAGGVTGYLGLRRPVLSLIVLAIAISFCVIVLHVLGSWLGFRNGEGDMSGLMALGVFSLIFILFGVLIGGAVGAFISRAQA